MSATPQTETVTTEHSGVIKTGKDGDLHHHRNSPESKPCRTQRPLCSRTGI